MILSSYITHSNQTTSILNFHKKIELPPHKLYENGQMNQFYTVMSVTHFDLDRFMTRFEQQGLI